MLCLAAVLAACAGTPPASTVTAPAATIPSSGAAAATDGSERGATKVGDYKLVVRDGQDYYCRRQGATGSRVAAKEVCLTKSQLQTMREGSQDALRDMQAPAGTGGISIGPPGPL